VLVFPTEFEALQREYPILFRRGRQRRLQAVALLGLDRDENLFLDGGPGGRATFRPSSAAARSRSPWRRSATPPSRS
jgi:hypothetical protein